MSEVFLRLITGDEPKNQVEIEKYQLSSWADQMASVEASAKSLLENVYPKPPIAVTYPICPDESRSWRLKRRQRCRDKTSIPKILKKSGGLPSLNI